jgi:transposase-like protein
MKHKAYKTYSREFKLEAVRLSGSGSKPVAEVARELGVHRNQIARWKVHFSATTGQAERHSMPAMRPFRMSSCDCGGKTFG